MPWGYEFDSKLLEILSKAIGREGVSCRPPVRTTHAQWRFGAMGSNKMIFFVQRRLHTFGGTGDVEVCDKLHASDWLEGRYGDPQSKEQNLKGAMQALQARLETLDVTWFREFSQNGRINWAAIPLDAQFLANFRHRFLDLCTHCELTGKGSSNF